MSGKNIKVTDKRMFTAEGELRDEYRHLEDAEPVTPTAAPPPPQEPAPQAAAPAADEAEADEPPSPDAPSFLELVAMLAEPASVYLGDVPAAGGLAAQNLEMARLHIDILDVLRHKTRGNLNLEESQTLTEVVRRLKMRYVEKRG